MLSTLFSILVFTKKKKILEKPSLKEGFLLLESA